MRRLFIAVLIPCGLLLVPGRAHALPAFARQYGFRCTVCHVGFPKLNDFGQRFRDDGYQIPGLEESEKTVLEGPIPLAIEASTGFSSYHVKRYGLLQGTASGFNIYGFNLYAGGILSRNIAFANESVVFSNILKDVLNVRVGLFEPSYMVFSSMRSLYLMEHYEVYDFTTPTNTFVFGDSQLGAEAAGHLESGLKYAIGVVNGTGGDPADTNYKDVYINLEQTFGPGEGQSSGQRLGVFAYYGWQPEIAGTVAAPTGETNGAVNRPFYRLGGDVSLNWSTFNLELFFMEGIDDRALNTLVPAKNYAFSGGFAELDWATLANDRLIASMAYNRVTPPSYDSTRSVDAYSALARYYFTDNIALHVEYTYRRTGIAPSIDESIASALINFAF